MSNSDHILVGGAPEGFDAQLLLSELEKSRKPVLHVARDDKRLVAMQSALVFFAPHIPVITFPAWDCLPFDRISPNPDVSATRMATLAALTHGMPQQFILLTTLNSATQKIPARSVLQQASFTATVGQRIDETALRSFLVRMGYSQAPTVMEHGDYAIRGGIIDIFPPGHSGPVRLDFFGDVLDGARRFDPGTQRTLEKLTEVELAPVSEVILDETAITRFRQNYRAQFGAAGADDPLYEAVSAGRKHQGLEHWLPFFHDGLETLFDYLPEASILIDDQVTPSRLARWESIKDQYETRHLAMDQKSRLDTVYKPCPPELLYLDEAAWDAILAGRRVLQLSPFAQASGPGVIDGGGRIGRNFSPERALENVSLFGALEDHIDAKRAVDQVIIASYSEGSRERMQGLMEDQGLKNATP
ncbi:MAG: transcription-repair coupling factor, partial [Paracoccaceae bacterium]